MEGARIKVCLTDNSVHYGRYVGWMKIAEGVIVFQWRDGAGLLSEAPQEKVVYVEQRGV